MYTCRHALVLDDISYEYNIEIKNIIKRLFELYH